MRNSQNYQIFQEIKKNYRNTFAYDPFSKESNYDIKKNYNDLSDFKLIVFLSKGPLFKEVYRKINLLKIYNIIVCIYTLIFPILSVKDDFILSPNLGLMNEIFDLNIFATSSIENDLLFAKE